MMLALPDPCVVLMIGASGSGKSTLAASLAAANTGLAVISYDSYQRRLPGDDGRQTCTTEAVALAHLALAKRCAAGMSTIVDGTHRQLERRTAVRSIADTHGLLTVAVALVVPLDQCLARQHARSRRVPREDVTAQHATLAESLPGLHREGYAAVVLVTRQ
jgi:predicted kinase